MSKLNFRIYKKDINFKIFLIQKFHIILDFLKTHKLKIKLKFKIIKDVNLFYLSIK